MLKSGTLGFNKSFENFPNSYLGCVSQMDMLSAVKKTKTMIKL